MAQATRRQPLVDPVANAGWGRGTREGLFIALFAVAVFLLVALLSYDTRDPGWSFSGPTGRVANQMGVVGAWFADIFLFLFGYLAYVFPVLIGLGALHLFRSDGVRLQSSALAAVRGVGFAMLVAGACGLASVHYGANANLPLDAGGIVGNLVGRALVSMFNFLGATLVLITVLLAGITLFTRLSWLAVMDVTGAITLAGFARIEEWIARLRQWIATRRVRVEREVKLEKSIKATRQRKTPKPRIEPTIAPVQQSARVERERQVPLFAPTANGIPPLDLLDPPVPNQHPVSTTALEAMSRQVELKLKDYGIDVEVVEVHPGPVVTRFELMLAPGLKVSKISALAKDLARSLSTISVRIVEVIPGKSVIGLELPNESVEIVALSEILRSNGYDASPSPLTLALGKDIAGRSMVVDLAKMPHLLVAGTTGSGKSVAINAMVLSLIYKATPAEVRLIMVDPKMLELSVYEGIGHLLAPVVTDMKDAGSALRWCVGEMERRYKLMSQLGVRNLAGYNRKVKDAEGKGTPILDPFHLPDSLVEATPLETMPSIVVVIDELADLMMTSGKKVEELIARLAQKARAAGIHLILATQRPSVDVITGLIKANIPSRIAFQVSSKIDSRTILDQGGAEQLLGHGDMLYLTPGMQAPTRIHGAYVSDAEVHRIVSHIKEQGPPEYIDEVLAGSGLEGDGFDAGQFVEADAESDPLYDQAVKIVTDTRRASISGVQRRLKVGYNRAARMIEQMEQAGLVGPAQTNGSREVLAGPAPVD
ncbi:MAG: DNA translocase FtsK 4TM domain-containing protein [Gammaproteobacteria bacterium]|nr:DNA translocase FtsK 4TM domain-containing protein [Gammaproteobacteria bacterium]